MECKDWNYKTYLGDCIDGMRLLPVGSVDFLFTDLPYGRTNCKWDTPIDLEAFWSEADRVVKKGWSGSSVCADAVRQGAGMQQPEKSAVRVDLGEEQRHRPSKCEANAHAGA